MSPAEYALLATALISFGVGSFAGHAAGYARRGDVERRRQIAALTGGPKYARTYDVHAPSGLFFHGPDKASAEAFASKYGGVVVPSE